MADSQDQCIIKAKNCIQYNRITETMQASTHLAWNQTAETGQIS